MKFIKVLSNDRELLSAEKLKDPVFVLWQKRNGILVCCSEPRAQGILSEDGSIVYQLEGAEKLEQRAEPDMVAVLIDESEYQTCVETLGDLDVIPPEENPDSGEGNNENEVETPMNAAQMRIKIRELEEKNAFLEECLLEMSQIVYS